MMKIIAIVLALMMGFPLSSFAAMRRSRSFTNHKPPLGTPLNSSSPLARGLVGLWCMNEGGGKTLSNSVKTGDLALTNNTWSISPFGSALSGAGTMVGTVAVAAGSPLDVIGTAISYGGWVYPTATGVFQLVIEDSNGAGDSNRHFSVFLDASGGSFLYVDLLGSFFEPLLSTPWVVNQWNHVFITWDGSNARCYINGVLSNTTSFAGTMVSMSGASIYIGEDVPNSNFGLFGRADMTEVYNRTLSASEVKQLAGYGPFSMFQPQTQVFLDSSPSVTPVSDVSQFFKSVFYKAVLR